MRPRIAILSLHERAESATQFNGHERPKFHG
jgi:hypothetical protein